MPLPSNREDICLRFRVGKISRNERRFHDFFFENDLENVSNCYLFPVFLFEMETAAADSDSKQTVIYDQDVERNRIAFENIYARRIKRLPKSCLTDVNVVLNT